MVTSKTPAPGEDILAASANNLYAGVSSADVEGFEERFALNSRLSKEPDGQLREDVYRARRPLRRDAGPRGRAPRGCV